jgi:subtilisin-like proprotein convertase family protein
MKRTLTFACILISFYCHAQQYTGNAGGIQNNGQHTYYNNFVSGLPQATLNGNFGILKVCLDITHPDVSEMNIHLQSPSGMSVQLSLGNSATGADYSNTCFESNNNNSITLATSPRSGIYKPVGYIGRFNNGQTGNGMWKLIVHDYNAFANAGTLNSWSITFGTLPETPVNFTSSDLPIVVINSNYQPITETAILVNMGIIDNGPNRNYMTDPYNDYNAKATIKIRGSSTRSLEKKSFSFETKDMSGNEQEVSLLGMPEEDDWALVAPYQDKTLMRDALAYYIGGHLGRYAPRFRTVEVVINNEYRGNYYLVERITRDSSRVPVSKLTVNDNTYPDVTGGYILKIDRPDDDGWLSLYPGYNQTGSRFYYQYVYPKGSEITTAQQNYIKSYLDTFETVMNSGNFADPTTGYPKYIDVESFVDYLIHTELTRNVDGYKLSSYLYKEKSTKGNKLFAGPVWDYNLAWGNCLYGNAVSPNGWQYQTQDNAYPVPTWWGKFMQDSNFVNKVYCRWHDLRQGVLSSSSINAFIDSMAQALNESQQRNFVHWPVMKAFIYPNPQYQPSMSFNAEITEMKNWIASRIGWLDWAIPGHCPVLTGDDPQGFAASVSVYPNPMLTTAAFHLYLEKDATVSLRVTDILGKAVVTVLNGHVQAGPTQIEFNRNDLPSGVYLYRMEIGHSVKTGKIIIQ